MHKEDHDTTHYGAAYQERLQAGRRASAERVMPLMLDLCAPSSIVDFGCGLGSWLAEAMAFGVADVLGVDGSWVDPAMLVIPPTCFRSVELRSPLDLGRRFDLALCLEVAEHLPAEAAPTLVETLTNHAPVVFFSAAVPGQGGQGHVNEAWPSAWRELFRQREFDCFDVLRARIWAEIGVEPWYRQNSLIFASREHLLQTPNLAARLAEAVEPPVDIAHPELFGAQVRWRADAESQSSQLRAEHARLKEAYEAQRIELDALRGSRSWRLTAPLRALTRFFRATLSARKGPT